MTGMPMDRAAAVMMATNAYTEARTDLDVDQGLVEFIDELVADARQLRDLIAPPAPRPLDLELRERITGVVRLAGAVATWQLAVALEVPAAVVADELAHMAAAGLATLNRAGTTWQLAPQEVAG